MDNGWSIVLANGAIYQAGSWYDTQSLRSTLAVFRSTDNGSNWDRRRLTADSGEIRSMVMSPVNSNLLLAGGRRFDGNYQSYSCMFRSTDAGLNWTEVGKNVFGSLYDYINGMVLDPITPTRVLAATPKGIYVSTDAGLTWTGPTQTVYATCITADPGTSGRFFVGAYDGVWMTTDAGGTWHQINNGLPVPYICSIVYDAANNYLYAGTDGRCVVRLKIDPAVSVEPRPESTPKEFELCQNYPNPFNPSTVIKYTVGVASGRWQAAGESGAGVSGLGTRVKLVVYDMLGRETAVLVDENKQPGSYQVQFDGSGLPSGVYFYRLTAGSYVESRNMVLVK